MVLVHACVNISDLANEDMNRHERGQQTVNHKFIYPVYHHQTRDAKSGFLLTLYTKRSVQKCEKTACNVGTAPNIVPAMGKQILSRRNGRYHQTRIEKPVSFTLACSMSSFLVRRQILYQRSCKARHRFIQINEVVRRMLVTDSASAMVGCSDEEVNS